MRSHFTGTFLCVAMGVAMTAAGQVPAQVVPAIDLQLRPVTQNVAINGIAEVGLYAVSNSPFNQGFLGVEVVFTWNAGTLTLLSATNPSPSPWSSTGFPFGQSDPHSVNNSVPPNNGQGLWRAFGQLGSSVTATPGGTLITTFRFRPNFLSAGTTIAVLDKGGIPISSPSGNVIQQNSVVLDFFSPGLNVVGALGSTMLSITQEGGPPNPTQPSIVTRSPQIDGVINKKSGISSIVVQFDRPVPASTISVSGVNNPFINGTQSGAGTSTHRLQFTAGNLPDQDLYSVTVQADGLFVAWDFSVLLGDCNQDGAVNIFDLAEMRTLLRAGAFDPNCNVNDTNGNVAINILDLAVVRTALRNGSSAP